MTGAPRTRSPSEAEGETVFYVGAAWTFLNQQIQATSPSRPRAVLLASDEDLRRIEFYCRRAADAVGRLREERGSEARS
jgi:hypothetical protein